MYFMCFSCCWQITAGICSCQVCNQHYKGEQEELTGKTAATQLWPSGNTIFQVGKHVHYCYKDDSVTSDSLQEEEIFTSLSAARSLLEQKQHRPLLLVEDSALEDFAGTYPALVFVQECAYEIGLYFFSILRLCSWVILSRSNWKRLLFVCRHRHIRAECCRHRTCSWSIYGHVLYF